MKVAGIVAEYNPFHYGHQYHIEYTKKLLGEECAAVCVMSGDFVQRGSPAAFDKHTRAECAARAGADLVFELPLPWSLSSAEGFARGAVGLLGELGVVTHLSFGSECGEVAPLQSLADILVNKNTAAKITEEMKQGIQFVAARQRVLEKEIGCAAGLLESPNNILGVEYLKALHNLKLDIEPITIARSGAGHDQCLGVSEYRQGEGGSQFRSASELRSMLAEGRDIFHFVPKTTAEIIFRRKCMGCGPVTDGALETAVISRLRMLPKEAFDVLPDASEGLENRLYTAARSRSTLEEIAAVAKSKRYALSRIRRMMMCAALGITADMTGGIPGYARLLACTEKGRVLLREINKKSHLPIITKPASAHELKGEAGRIFELTASARDLYVLGYNAVEQRDGGSDWRSNPVII